MPRRYVRKAAKMMRRKVRRKSKARVARRVNNVYRFKRLTRECRLAHYNGQAPGTFIKEDPAGILTLSDWAAESMPNCYQVQGAVVNRLSQVQVPSDFTNLFDRFKLTGVKATFLYQVSDATAGGSAVLPTIMYATDYDDDLVPLYSDMRQKQNVKQRILTANRPFSIFYRPKLNGIISVNDTFNFGLAGAKGWVDAQQTAADHFGLKFSINNMYSTASTNTQLEIKFTYYFSMKDPQ